MAKSKLERFAELENMNNVFQPQHKEIFKRDYYLKGKWKQEIFHNTNPLILEIGCGKGEYSVGMATMFPNKNFIGIDIKGARMWIGAKIASEKEIKNVIFLRLYAEFIESVFEQNEVDEIWITFPDPQMAKFRKRLTGSRFLSYYRNILKPNGIINLKTDSSFLYTYTKDLIKINNLASFSDIVDLYKEENKDKINDILGIKTFYEQQWLSRGKTIKYLSFSPWQEEKKNIPETLKEPLVEIERDDYHSETQYMVGHKTFFEKFKKQ